MEGAGRTPKVEGATTCRPASPHEMYTLSLLVVHLHEAGACEKGFGTLTAGLAAD